jgi:hypothetical protein
LVLASSIFVFGGLDVVVKEGKVLPDSSVGDWSNKPDAYIDYLSVDSDASFSDDVYISGTLDVVGKATFYGGHDPAYVMYNQQTRQEIIDMVKRDVPPEKQRGAVLFFNKDTKRLENYIPDEGKFYDLQGNLLYTMPTIEVATNYKALYYFDRITGEAKVSQRTIYDRYRIKKGYRLDTKTGHFINMATGDIVPKEVAVELQKGL